MHSMFPPGGPVCANDTLCAAGINDNVANAASDPIRDITNATRRERNLLFI